MSKVNYYTEEGLKKLRDELDLLRDESALKRLKLLQRLEIKVI